MLALTGKPASNRATAAFPSPKTLGCPCSPSGWHIWHRRVTPATGTSSPVRVRKRIAAGSEPAAGCSMWQNRQAIWVWGLLGFSARASNSGAESSCRARSRPSRVVEATTTNWYGESLWQTPQVLGSSSWASPLGRTTLNDGGSSPARGAGGRATSRARRARRKGVGRITSQGLRVVSVAPRSPVPRGRYPALHVTPIRPRGEAGRCTAPRSHSQGDPGGVTPDPRLSARRLPAGPCLAVRRIPPPQDCREAKPWMGQMRSEQCSR